VSLGGRADQTGTPGRALRAAAACLFLAATAAMAQPPMTPDAARREAPQLADLLALRPGLTIAEIGAGHGEMTVEMAKRVGPSGMVYSTELNTERLADIRKAVERARLTNVKVVRAGEHATNLPDACCQSIFMREVYHQFTDPSGQDASLFRALQPGGLIAVIDFAPGGASPPPDVAADRGGDGVPMDVVIREMTQAGFQLAREIPDWADGLYAVLFQKPQKR
jgi:ubiquinone/menaquinone biosynthesis C-methylase UbiE